MNNRFQAEAEASNSFDRQSNDQCWILRNFEETYSLGESLISIIPNLKLLLLEGPLGAGKTSLVKGLATKMGIQETITSPTFALAQHYPKGNPPLVHLDLYRLEDPKSANELFLQEEEEVNDINGLMVVEWPERLELVLEDAWKIKIDYLEDKKGRKAQLISPRSQIRNDSTSSVVG